MTQDEIIRMAREVDAITGLTGRWIFLDAAHLERFAALVAAHEREKPVTFPANGLLVQEPSRDTPTGSQSDSILSQPFAYYRDELNVNGELVDIEYNGLNQFNGGRFGKPLYTTKQIESAVLAEREACAKECEKRSHRNDDMGAICAAAIRARGQDGTD